MKIYVATYEDGSGFGYQKVFKYKSLAKKWLRKQYDRDFGEEESDTETESNFKDRCDYGAWTGKIKSFTI